MVQEISSNTSVNNTSVLQEYSKCLVDKELLQQLEEKQDSKAIQNRASKSGMRKAKAQIQNQANLKEIIDAKKATSLCMSAIQVQKETNPELLDILIKYGNNPDGIPALHYAIKMQDIRSVLLLLQHGADPNSHSQFITDYEFSKPLTALDYAAYYGNLDIINILIDYGAKINPELRFDESGELIEVEFNRLATPLFFAAQNNQAKAIQLLVKRGAKIDPFSEYEGNANTHVKEFKLRWFQPLYIAISSDSLEAFNMFKDLGVNYTKGVYKEPYYLHVACLTNASHVLREMLKNGCFPDVRNSGVWGNSLTPLLVASMQGSYECCNVLLEYNANVKAIAPGGYDVLLNIITNFQNEFKKPSPEKTYCLIKKIIEKGSIDINEKRNTTSLFHTALYSNNLSLLQFLLDIGADINLLDGYNRTPLDLAKNITNLLPETIQWLLNHGAKTRQELIK